MSKRDMEEGELKLGRMSKRGRAPQALARSLGTGPLWLTSAN